MQFRLHCYHTSSPSINISNYYNNGKTLFTRTLIVSSLSTVDKFKLMEFIDLYILDGEVQRPVRG